MTNSQNLQSSLISQSLAMAYNYINTGRPNKAVEMLGVVQRIEPENPLVPKFFQLIAANNGLCSQPELAEFGNLWGGENLDGATIEVFCDQGMGDTVNMLRYLYIMKERWSCKIILNCYAYFEQFKRLIEEVDYIDEFVRFHKQCDYHTNIFSLPAILYKVDLPVYYPAHFSLIMEKVVPSQPKLTAHSTFSTCRDVIERVFEKPAIGVAWRSNPDNILSLTKSVPTNIIEQLVSDSYDLYSLDPNECPAFMKKLELRDLYDTTAAINCLQHIVSVDTVVLHLAGAVGVPTFGLIPDDCDPRWGTEEKTVWYPSVKLARQQADWAKAVKSVKEALESLVQI